MPAFGNPRKLQPAPYIYLTLPFRKRYVWKCLKCLNKLQRGCSSLILTTTLFRKKLCRAYPLHRISPRGVEAVIPPRFRLYNREKYSFSSFIKPNLPYCHNEFPVHSPRPKPSPTYRECPLLNGHRNYRRRERNRTFGMLGIHPAIPNLPNGWDVVASGQCLQCNLCGSAASFRRGYS